MASFISGLSLFIFVLINGCFTLPISQIQFPDFTTTSFYNDFTTENSFNIRAVTDREILSTPFNDIKRSKNEGIFLQTESNPTVPTDIKRSLSEAYNFGTATISGQYESVSGASQQERTGEKTVTFSQTTEHPSAQKGTTEKPITFTDVPTTRSLNTLPHELEIHHIKRVFPEQDVNSGLNKRSNDSKIGSQFTTSFTPLFTSTSSAVAPELYTPVSTEFSSLQTSTRKYVGSLVDREEDTEGLKKNSRKHGKGAEEYREEEKEYNEKVADSDKKTDGENKRVKSGKKSSIDSSADEKYLFGELFDQESSRNRPTLPSNLAILDESVVPVTAELVRSSTTTTTIRTKVADKYQKLNQGEESS